LGVVTPPGTLRGISTEAATVLDRSGDPELFIAALSGNHPTLGDLGTETRAGLLIALDEAAEAEALESEWREAEELASIVDGELSDVPGFEDFRREILREED
jgi:hypothetical protein